MIVAQGSGSLRRTQSVMATVMTPSSERRAIGRRPGESGHPPDNRENHTPMKDIEAQESHPSAGKAKEPESKPAEGHVNRVSGKRSVQKRTAARPLAKTMKPIGQESTRRNIPAICQLRISPAIWNLLE